MQRVLAFILLFSFLVALPALAVKFCPQCGQEYPDAYNYCEDDGTPLVFQFYIWNADNGTDKIYKIDPSSGQVLKSFDSPGDVPIGLAWDGTYLWNADYNTDKIYKINPNSGSVVDFFDSPSDIPMGLAIER